MTRPSPFSQAAIVKLLKAAKLAGTSVASIEIDPTGKLVARFGIDEAPADGVNEWDEVLTGGEAKRTANKRH